MAETKLTVKPNNIVVYETFEGNTPLEVREVTNNDFSNSLPLDGDTDDKYTKHRYYYLNISWDDTDLLDLAGHNNGLHKLNINYNTPNVETYCASVYPKILNRNSDSDIPTYLTRSNAGNVNPRYDGYTLHFADLNIKDSGSLYSSNGNIKIAVEKVRVDDASFYHWGNLPYYAPEVEKDVEIFNESSDFDSSKYITSNNPNTYKLVYKPYEKDSKILHRLTCYTDYTVPPNNTQKDLYFYDKDKNEYVSLTTNDDFSYSIVTFIPQKNPTNAMSDSSNVRIEWVLCEFCRGIASSTNFEDVDSTSNSPARVKYEWRPLLNKNGQTIILSTIEFEDFFHTYKDCQEHHEFYPTNDKIPFDENGNFSSVEVKSYNIMEYSDKDSTYTDKIFVDNRKLENEDKNIHLQIENRNEDTYVVTIDKFYSDRNNGVFEENDYILLDSEGYPLYSPELLINFGIGFLKASWVFYEEGYGLKASLSAQDLLTSWYLQGDRKTKYSIFNNDGTIKSNTIIGKIYSTKYLMTNQDWGDGNKLIIPDYDTYNEEIIYEYGDLLGINADRPNIVINTGAENYPDQIDWIYASRQILYEFYGDYGIQTMSKTSNGYVPIDVGDSPVRAILDIQNYNTQSAIYEFMTWRKTPKRTDNLYYSYTVRYRISDYDLSRLDWDKGPEYKNFAFWVPTDNNKEVLTTIDNFSHINPVTNYNEDGELEPIIKDIKYIITYTLTTDIYPIDSIGEILPNTWTYAKNYKQAFLGSHIINIKSISTKSNISAEEYLDDQIKTYKYLTPNEYYSTTYIDEDEPQQNWFWLDSISNWCRYELSSDNQTIVLKLWNGLGSWDSIIDILYTVGEKDFNKLLKQYLYDGDFFNTGAYYTIYPGKKKEAYEPLVAKIPAEYYHEKIDSRGIIEYNTLILPRDNVSILYKNNMSNTDDLIYYNNDYNDYARSFYNKPNPAIPEPIKYKNEDTSRKYAVGITTQYCPCVFKLRNGNLAISNYFVAHTSNDKGLYRNVLSAEEANNRCKNIFGDGSNKTIEEDWKRYYKTDDTEEIKSDLRSINDETLYGSASLIQANAASTINKITIAAMRPNPTTNNRVIQDYLERWDK